MTKLFRTRQSGVTFLEVMVVISIIGILSAIMIPNYKEAQARFALQRSAHKLAQDIRRTAEMALSSDECPIPPIDGGCGGKTVFGYGVHFDNNTNNDRYDLYVDLAPPYNEKWTGGDGTVETIFFEKGVIIKQISPGGNFSINFKPPAPTVRIRLSGLNDTDTDQDGAIITLALKNNPTKTKIIKINRAGLVNVE